MEETTRAADAVLILFSALSETEQEEVAQRITELQLRRLAGDESAAAKYLRSLSRVAEHLGHTPSSTEYRQVSEELRAAGEDVESFSRVYAHYRSWSRAREALALADSSSKAIEARFGRRLVGKRWRYSEGELREAMMRCAEYYGHPPLVLEFEWWREREIELARARGEELDLFLPTRAAYRRRYGGWEEALLHFGFTPEELERRYDRRAEFSFADANHLLPEDLPVAQLREPAGKLPLAADQAQRLVDAYRVLPKRSRYVLTARLGLGMKPAYLKVVAKPLKLHLSRVAQLQGLTLAALCQAAAGDSRGRPNPTGLRDDVVATLRALALPLASRSG